MQHISGTAIYSASDLSSFLACAHLALLEQRALHGGPKAPKYDDPSLEVLWQRGLEHERRQLEAYRAKGLNVVEVVTLAESLPYDERLRKRTAATLDAMKSGADVIYQAALFDAPWLGYADFLLRVERPGRLGAWSYEVLDTKLAREAKGGALLQVLLYGDLLARVQGVAPEHAHIALGGPDRKTETFRVADYAAYFRFVRDRFLAFMAAPPPIAAAAEPVEHCRVCAWKGECVQDRRDVDHLSLVAGITSHQRHALRAHGVETLEALATMAAGASLDGVTRAGFERIHGQARIQLAGRRASENRYELLPHEENQGLAALPEPSDGDLFFDLEGDPYALDDGLEYLFGFATRDGGYTGWWALDRASERRVFEQFIDFVTARREQYPDLHVYHYNHYEPTALKKLMGRYATRERELDALLRGEVFVDLYRVVKQGLRASVESYSIKELEPFYSFTREVDLRSARSALANFEAWMAFGGERDDELLRRIEGYNADDCRSTLRLHSWLESLREELAHAKGATVPRPAPSEDERSAEAEERDVRIDALVARLTCDVPDDPDARTPEQHGRWLNAQLIEFHRREDKAFWWEYFRCMELGEDELIEDRSTIGGMRYEGEVGRVKKSLVHRYRYPAQEHAIRVGHTPRDPATKSSAGEVVAVDAVEGYIDLKRGENSTVPHPSALVPHDHVRNQVLRDSLLRLAEATAEHGLPHPHRCAVDLLLRNPPHAGQPEGASLQLSGEGTVEAAVRLVERLDRTVLPIQGPPGAGKTYTAARMIVHALALGKRVGVTAQGHAVINNLLREVCDAAREQRVPIRGVQKVSKDEQGCGFDSISCVDGYDALHALLAQPDVQLVAGTAWLWSRSDMVGSVDLLVVDEAGQFSLANALAVAPATDSLVLVGDPQQLEQPIQGSHPPGVHVSALEHLLEGAHTVAADRGLFLDRTWRLHPAICEFTSELFYDGRLRSRSGLKRQRIVGGPFPGSGLRFVPVAHSGNQSEAVEEVALIASLVSSLIEDASWVDRAGELRPIGVDDVLIVAPYNAQVALLRSALPGGARVGTVDKFQGQEAPIVICSMTTSSATDAPRGMGFLYSPHRLNVATSRARCLAVVVASPELLRPECRTPAQMRLANAFCRLGEVAGAESGLELRAYRSRR